MKEITKEDFEKSEKYIVTRGMNYNDDRCFEVDVELEDVKKTITLCADEQVNKIKICQIDMIDANEDRNEEKVIILKTIRDLAEKATYNAKQKDDYDYYLKYAKVETKCCDYNCVTCNCNFNK